MTKKTTPAKKSLPIKATKPILIIGLTILLLGLFASVVVFARQRFIAGESDEVYSSDGGQLLDQLSKLVVLPEEQPVVSVLDNLESVASKPFFKNAQQNDLLFQFTQSSKVILYRPSENKIVDIGIISDDQTYERPNLDPMEKAKVMSSQDMLTDSAEFIATESASNEKKVKVAFYNASDVVGFTRVVESRLVAKYEQIQTSARAIANNDYSETLIIDLSGSNSFLAREIAKEIGGSLSSMPEGEVKPDDSDILIILGKSEM